MLSTMQQQLRSHVGSSFRSYGFVTLNVKVVSRLVSWCKLEHSVVTRRSLWCGCRSSVTCLCKLEGCLPEPPSRRAACAAVRPGRSVSWLALVPARLCCAACAVGWAGVCNFTCRDVFLTGEHFVGMCDFTVFLPYGMFSCSLNASPVCSWSAAVQGVVMPRHEVHRCW